MCVCKEEVKMEGKGEEWGQGNLECGEGIRGNIKGGHLNIREEPVEEF